MSRIQNEFVFDTVVVTGGASGIGKAFCEKFAELGASNIVVVDLRYEDAKKVADSIPGGVPMVRVSYI
jgi:NAD(P)-dependent dehydrogenase (short-subunit alcohol dehydrogenase family)